jgi:RNA polymerase sporulation-specific sigma factor
MTSGRNGGLKMLYSTLMLMMSSAFLMLRLSPGGSFPRPLSEAEECKYLEAWLQGDLEARNVLIEHNLRLVAHILKKMCSKMQISLVKK